MPVYAQILASVVLSSTGFHRILRDLPRFLTIRQCKHWSAMAEVKVTHYKRLCISYSVFLLPHSAQ